MIIDQPLVSIVAVCYNHEDYLVETLDSIINQSYPNIELIIIDDCSQDASVKKIKKWIQSNNIECQFIARKKNVGLCKNLNDGIERSKGKYYQSIACDDVMEHNKIEEQVVFLEKESEDVKVVCSNFSTINHKGHLNKTTYFDKNFLFPEDVFSSILEKYMGYNILIHSPTVLLRKSVFKEVGLYDENLKQEDFYMWLLISSKFQIKYLDKVLVKYRELDNSLSKEFKFGNAYYYERTKVLSRFYNLKGKKLKAIVNFQVKQIKKILRHSIKFNDITTLDIGLKLLGELKQVYTPLGMDNLLYKVYNGFPIEFNDWARINKFSFEKLKYQVSYKLVNFFKIKKLISKS